MNTVRIELQSKFWEGGITVCLAHFSMPNRIPDAQLVLNYTLVESINNHTQSHPPFLTLELLIFSRPRRKVPFTSSPGSQFDLLCDPAGPLFIHQDNKMAPNNNQCSYAIERFGVLLYKLDTWRVFYNESSS